jgi:hypothetical protein
MVSLVGNPAQRQPEESRETLNEAQRHVQRWQRHMER